MGWDTTQRILRKIQLCQSRSERTKGRFLEHRETAIMDGEVTYVEPKEHISLQLWQVVVPKSKVEYHDVRFTLKHGHSLADLRHVGDLAYNVQAGFLHAAVTGRDIVVGRTDLRYLR